MLGEVAIHQQELGAAEIYIQEALFIAMSRNDRLATARCYQQLGHLNIRARALARQASNTYDQLWQARNAISRGYYNGVAESLTTVIEENLAIRRFGAAADSWEALASLYDQTRDDYQAQQARIEAARLYASTGQYNRTRRLINGLDPGQISDPDLYQLKQEIDGLYEQHQQDLAQTAEARDYQMLYHHYRRLGDIERAWEFRIKSSQSLAKTTDRSMFQRQADVIAVLYNSNFAMERARRYLDQADTIFGDGDLQELLDETREMKILIF
jgi:flagellin-specific chaperone FliS